MVDFCVPRRILGVIPARYASSRFPGKALATLGSKTMLQHVWERVNMARYLTDAVIATDDQRIYAAARSFGAAVRMTRSDHVSGTDRVAEVASTGDAELIVNIQGDEPLIDPAAIDMGTPKRRSRTCANWANPETRKPCLKPILPIPRASPQPAAECEPTRICPISLE